MPVATENFESLRSILSAPVRLETDVRELFRVDGLLPQAVVEPASTEELMEVVRWGRSRGAALVPVTSGCYLPLGNPPRAADVAVSLARLNRILHYDPGDLTFGAEAGMLLAEAKEHVAKDRLILPADPPYADRAGIGGLLAAHASGPLRFGYGTWRDFVVGMKFVSGEGKLVKTGGRVVKNVAGYDLSKLLIGSLGTLGIITEVNFKLFPAPTAAASFIFSFQSAEAALEARMRIVHSTWQPRALELLDPRAATLTAAPSLSSEVWSLIVAVGGVEAVIARYESDFSRLAKEIAAADFRAIRGEDNQLLWKALRTLLARVREANPATTVVKGALPLTSVGSFLAKAQQVAERYELPAAATAHAGSGIAFLYLLPAERTPDAAKRMAQAATEMIHAGNNLGGRVTIPWCPAEVKADVNVWGPLRDDYPLMKKLKAAFDPDGILNPGRFVGGL
jgi:glycolate oxidase FAD binding subunit